MHFLGLSLEDRVRDATTLWLYREALARAGLVEQLFTDLDAYLRARGYLAMRGGRSSTRALLLPLSSATAVRRTLRSRSVRCRRA